MSKNGLLLVNLGTPDFPKRGSVAKYLREFLSDPYVIDIPAPLRWMLVHLIIAPFRSKTSAEAYKKIWTEAGSPLLSHTKDLGTEVSELIGKDWAVEFAMRYGRPSIHDRLLRLRTQGVEKLWVVPLYPQYALSSTESSMQKVNAVIRKVGGFTQVQALTDFFDEPGFIEELKQSVASANDSFQSDHLLMSYHGLPLRHLQKAINSRTFCQQSESGCCSVVGKKNRLCYRAQCWSTSRALANQLGWPQDQWSMSFQSRLGRAEWIRPYTDQVIKELPQKGVRRLLVVCPSFVADCLETLEEIGIRAKEDFIAAGGEDLRLVPCLNAGKGWASTVASYPANPNLAWRKLDL